MGLAHLMLHIVFSFAEEMTVLAGIVMQYRQFIPYP